VPANRVSGGGGHIRGGYPPPQLSHGREFPEAQWVYTGGSIREGYPLQRDFSLGGPIGNLAGTPMGQLEGGQLGGGQIF